MTNFSSNVTTVVVMTGVGISIALGIDGVNTVAITMALAFTAALAYCIPASFASIAVLYGDEYSEGSTIFRYGTIALLLTVLVVSFGGYPYALLFV